MGNFAKKVKNESGVILMASTMGIFILLSIFAFYLARFSVLETQSGAYHVHDIKVRNIAMAGAEHGLQIYKTTRSTNSITKNFNQGSYTVSFDSNNDETGGSLTSREHFLTMMVSGTLSDVQRNIRFFLSSMPEAFSFSFYGNNSSGGTFSRTSGAINGDMFFKGDVSSNSGTSSGITYTSTGNGGVLLSAYPTFPEFSDTYYENLLASVNLYNNYSFDFDGIDDFVYIPNSDEINTGSAPHKKKTIEAWFKADSVFNTSHRQTIYEQGGTVRGLNIYIYEGLLYVGGWNEPDGESDWDPGTWLVTTGTGDEIIESGKWHHVALTLDASDANSVQSNVLKGYLDGKEFGSGSGSKLWSHSGDVSIGRNRDTKFSPDQDFNTRKYFSGLIDDVRLWNTARTAQEINDYKDKALNGDEDNLVAYYDFQENNAEDKQDQSNNDGTIKNGAAWVNDGPELSVIGSATSYTTAINLSSQGNQLLVNGDLNISGTTVIGTGQIVASGNITISSTNVAGDVIIVSGGNINISGSSTLGGTTLSNSVIIYSKGDVSFTNSIIYGLVISKGSGSLQLSGTKLYGAILNYSPNFNLTSDSDVIGSVVSNYSVDLLDSGSSITRSEIPELNFAGQNLGLNPFVVPGSYLEY